MQDQITNLIAEVLFYGWKRHALDPRVRERRNRANSNVEWVQRMVVPPTRGEVAPASESVAPALREARRRGVDGPPLGSR